MGAACIAVAKQGSDSWVRIGEQKHRGGRCYHKVSIHSEPPAIRALVRSPLLDCAALRLAMQGNIVFDITADPTAGQCGAGLIEYTLYYYDTY